MRVGVVLFPMAPRRGASVDLSGHLGQPGVLGAAMDYVKVEPHYRGIADYLLANVLVVEEH